MPSCIVLEDRGILAVSGPDRRSFLQGLISNDIERMSAAEVRYGALLTPQGRYLHDFMIADAGEAIWLETERARLADLQRRLLLYRLRAKVALAERPELAVAAIFGPGAAALVGLPEVRGAARPLTGGVAFVDPRLADLGVRAVLPRAEAHSFLKALALTQADFAAYDRLRRPEPRSWPRGARSARCARPATGSAWHCCGSRRSPGTSGLRPARRRSCRPRPAGCGLARAPLAPGSRRGDLPAGGDRSGGDIADIDLRHRPVERPQHRIGQRVVVFEAAAQPAAPVRQTAAGMRLEGRLARIERG